jgi:hypothetical protein
MTRRAKRGDILPPSYRNGTESFHLNVRWLVSEGISPRVKRPPIVESRTICQIPQDLWLLKIPNAPKSLEFLDSPTQYRRHVHARTIDRFSACMPIP